jgi:acetylornithine deacetylase
VTVKPLETTALLERLIAFDTTSRNSNLEMVDFVSNYADRPGVSIERNPAADGTKANLLITVGQRDGTERQGLVLSGHMDVVPAEEPEWQSDPFRLTRREDHLVARGACDMKAFLAAALNVAVELEPRQCRHPLVLLFTYDEEVGTLGAKHFVETWSNTAALPRNAVIGEPTSLVVVPAHKGHLTMRVTIAGRSAHSGLPHLGVNAVERGAEVMAALADLRDRLIAESSPHRDRFPEVPHVALSVTRIAGGTAINVIPDRCVLEMSVRTLPGSTGDTLKPRIRDAIAGALAEDQYEIQILAESPPMVCRDGADVVRALRDELGQTVGSAASYATDAGWFQQLDMDCVLYGPGDIGKAHRPNEFVPLGEFVAAESVLTRLVDTFCMRGSR